MKTVIAALNRNGLDDALWALRAVDGHDREIRLYAVWCARRVKHLMTDPRSIDALAVAERYANGLATDEQLAAARAAARGAVWAAVSADAAAEAAAEAAAMAAVAASRAAERKAQAAELRRVCECIETGIDPYPREG